MTLRQTNLVGVEVISYANTFFRCNIKFDKPLSQGLLSSRPGNEVAMWVKLLAGRVACFLTRMRYSNKRNFCFELNYTVYVSDYVTVYFINFDSYLHNLDVRTSP